MARLIHVDGKEEVVLPRAGSFTWRELELLVGNVMERRLIAARNEPLCWLIYQPLALTGQEPVNNAASSWVHGIVFGPALICTGKELGLK